MANAPKRHHFVPQCYLSSWANLDGHVAVRRRETKEIFTPHPKNVTIESHLYGPVHVAKQVEDLFSKVEADWPKLKQKLAGGELLSSDERELVAIFIALQVVRLPDHFIQGEIASRVAEHCGTTEPSRDQVGDYLEKRHLGFRPETREVEAAWSFVTAILRIHRSEGGLTRPEAIGLGLDIAIKKLAPFILSCSWKVEHCRKRSLITSDRPVTYWAKPSKMDQLQGLGMVNASEIWLPLDPQSLLTLTNSGGATVAGVVDVKPRRFEVVNSEIAARCSKCVVATPHRSAALMKMHLGKHGPALRFNMAPGIRRLPDGSTEPMGDVLHMWTPRY